jgi:opacity protein-like surface antigen
MKRFLIAAMLAALPLAQARAADLPAACGPMDVKFQVNKDKTKHEPAEPEPGKALVYFFQDTGKARIGIDGAWAGANVSHSYFSIAVEPGEHHLCAKVELPDNPMELAHFTAEPGGHYFFRGRVVVTEVGRYLLFGTVDNDEAQQLLHDYSLSLFKVGK